MQVENPVIFMEAIPLLLSLNKLHLFSMTQHRFILIQIVPFTVCYMFRPLYHFCVDIPDYGLSTGRNM
jgi:hypothetical protein